MSKKTDHLENNIELLKHSIATIHDTLLWFDADNKIVYINDAGCGNLGYTREELIGKHIRDINPKATPEALKNAWKQLRATGFITFETMLKRKNGTEFSVEVFSTYIKFAGNEYHCGTAIDITERRQTEEKLRKSGERFRWIFEQGSIGMAFSDARYFFIKANRAFCSMLEYTEQELTKLTFKDITHPDHLNKDTEAVEKLLRGDISVYKTEKKYITKSGEIIHGALTLSAVRDLNNNFEHAFIMLENITEQKKSEENRVKFEQQLQQTQKLESLGVLAGGIAHDFNNLLGGIFGYIDLARMESANEKTSSYLSKALATMDRARGLTQQLLTFAKGGAPIRKISYLFPFIQETAQFALSGSNVSCRFEISENLRACNFDMVQLGQVIDNIVINAQQAMPMGGVLVISASNITLKKNEIPTLDKGNYVKISIKDTGIGMSPEILPRIFDPFFTTKQKGSGLGLSTAFSIIKRHEGFIDVESQQGKGSVFHIYLPASNIKPVEIARKKILEHKGKGEILVMDDEEGIRRVTKIILESLGYSVTAKKDAKSTLSFFNKEKTAKHNFCALILDLTVPGSMGGKEVAEKIRKKDEHVPIFVSSGYAEDPVMANPRRYGFTDSIRKPFNKSELIVLLNKYMKNPIK